MKITNSLIVALGIMVSMPMLAHKGHDHAPKVEVTSDMITKDSQWKGKRVGFLGDSMTDPRNASAKAKYWEYLEELLGITPEVYARSGYQWDGIYNKAVEMHEAVGDSIDAIIIWAGTNDYNHSKPIGEFYTEYADSANVNGIISPRMHREFVMTDSTFCGNINRVMAYLKSNYPTQQIIIMTPIHRGYACFNEKNVQPDENFANGQGLYLETYIDTLKRAGTLWGVPVIDMHSLSGLYPNFDSHTRYFHSSESDRLHPNADGHFRIARTLQYQLLALPSTF